MTDYTDREAFEVGVLQKQYINGILLVYVAAFFIPYAIWMVGIFGAYFVYKIADAQKSSVAWLWALSQVIPYIGLGCLLILSQNATRILKGKGIKVGLLGAKAGELDKLVPAVASTYSNISPQTMIYTIHGAHRDTGNEMNITVQAASEGVAIKEANRCGILVSTVVAANRPTISTSRNMSWLKVGGGLVAVIAAIVLLIGAASVLKQTVEPTTEKIAGPSTITAASATKACWRSINQIDLELHSLVTEDPVTFWEQNYIRYGTLDLDKVDPDLKTLTKDWVTVSVDMHNELKQMQAELQEIDATGSSILELGSTLGSTNQENPQGGAVAGSMIFGLMAIPIQESARQELNDRHEPALTELTQRIKDLSSRFQQIGPVLQQRYGVEFD